MQQILFIDPLLIFLICSTRFGGQTHPSSGALFDCIYSFLYNSPILLPADSNIGALYQKLYIQSKSAAEDG